MTNSTTQGPARKRFISAVSAGIVIFGGSLCVAGMSMADTISSPNPTASAEAPRFTPIAPADAPKFTPIAPAHEAPSGKADTVRGSKGAAGHGDSRGGHSRGGHSRGGR